MNQMESAKISLLGDRSNNQDRCAILSAPGCIVMVLGDGLGGHPKGEVAAQILLNSSQQMFNKSMKPIPSPEKFMHACIQLAHQSILDYGKRQHPPISPKTTAVLATIQNGMVYWAHVGDSRFYLIRDGAILAQTRDHSLVQLMSSIHTNSDRLREYNRNSITRCLGGETAPPTPTLGAPTNLMAGDTLLLCSDGLWSQLTEKELLAGLTLNANLHARMAELGEMAQSKGAPNSDNITACALHWPGQLQSGQAQGSEDDALDAAIMHLSSLIEKHA